MPEGLPRLSHLPAKVRQTLDRRFNDIQSFNDRSAPFLRLVSNAEVKTEDGFVSILDRSVLMGGVLRNTFGSSYRVGSTNRPFPGITSVDVTPKGQYGSIRQATISWTAPSLKDLEEFGPYFLTPVVTCILEWGFGAEGQRQLFTAEEVQEYFKDFKNPNNVSKFYEKAKTSGGRYDGMVGRITNFSINPSDDGGYECQTEITALGETLLYVDIFSQNFVPGSGKKDNAEDESKEKQSLLEYIETTIEAKITNNQISPELESGDILLLTFNEITYAMAIQMKLTENEVGKIIQKLSFRFAINNAVAIFNPVDNVNSFVDFINGKNIANIGSSDNTHKYITLLLLKRIINETCNLGNDTMNDSLATISLEPDIISNHQLLFSTDPQQFFFNNGFSQIRGKVIKKMSVPDEDGSFSGLSGDLNNIYLNIDYLKVILGESSDVKTFLNRILNDLEEISSDLWDLNLYADPALENTLRIIDYNYSPPLADNYRNSPELLKFPSYSGRSYLMEQSIDLKMNDKMTMTAFFGSNKSENDRTVINGIRDRHLMSLFGNVRDKFFKDMRHKSGLESTSISTLGNTGIKIIINNSDENRKSIGIDDSQLQAIQIGQKPEDPELPNRYPVDRGIVTSVFDDPTRTEHYGIDIAQNRDSLIYATAPGTITYVNKGVPDDFRVPFGETEGRSRDELYGNWVEIEHKSSYAGGLRTRYFHMKEGSNDDLKVGDTVYRGQPIGQVGGTGHTKGHDGGHHLHYEIRINGKPEDPAQFLPGGALLIEGTDINILASSKSSEIIKQLNAGNSGELETIVEVKKVPEPDEPSLNPEDNVLIVSSQFKNILATAIHGEDSDIEVKKRMSNILMPIEVSVTLDGISGFIPGNVFQIQNIPRAYTDNGIFVTVGKSDSISDTWKTTIKGMYKVTT